MKFLCLSTAALAVAEVVAASAVKMLTPQNFDEEIGGQKSALVAFTAPWCGHCKSLSPTYEELATNFASASDKITIAKVDADEHKSLGKRFGVQGFPTIKWFGSNSDKPEDYQGGRDLDSLSGWVTEKTGIKPKAKKAAPSSVTMLTDKTFAQEIGSQKDVLVAFTAPWCGHCKRLIPTWESVAEDFAAEPTVIVAKVDAEAENSKATAKDQSVTSYPTIKFFPKGSKNPIAYDGARTEEALVTYLNDKAGTHRLVGGGLNANAGTIDALDSILAKMVPDQTFATISEEFSKTASSLKDKSAEYYSKVAAKMGKSKDYAQKELKRLEGILKKGGLAQTKRDDLTTRTNILHKFTEWTKDKAEGVKQEL